MGLNANKNHTHLAVRPCVEEDGQVMRPRPHQLAQFFGVYKAQDDGTEEWIADFVDSSLADHFVRCSVKIDEQQF